MVEYYQLLPVVIRDRVSNDAWEIYAIDRRPNGDLAALCQDVCALDVAGECLTGACSATNRQRVGLRLPEDLRQLYHTEPEQHYVTPVNLPAVLTWLAPYGYADVDFRHIDCGIWLSYTNSQSRSLPTTQARAARPLLSLAPSTVRRAPPVYPAMEPRVPEVPSRYGPHTLRGVRRRRGRL